MKTPLQNLVPFSPSESEHRFQVSSRLTFQNKSIHLLYNVFGPIQDLLIQSMMDVKTSPSSDPLWEKTCFEFFMGPRSKPEYLEWNFSTAGEWRSTLFSDYRNPAPATPTVPFPPLLSLTRPSEDQLVFSSTIFLPESAWDESEVDYNITVILQYATGAYSYWALRHTRKEKPDFHDRGGFIRQ